MLRIYGDLWALAGHGRSAVCVTTNGAVRRDGACVMGRGCARQAAQLDPEVPFLLGSLIREHGNVVHVIRDRPGRAALLSFPVKDSWEQEARLSLIEASCRQLVALADERDWINVLLPRPGCGNGRLTWAEVGPVVEPLLDDRFAVVHTRPW